MVYELELKEGTVKIKGMEERVMIIPARMISEMGKEFYKIVGDASKVMMREVGKCVGQCMVEIVENELKKDKNEANLRELLEAVSTFLHRSGFGKVSLEETEGGYKVIIEDAPSLGEKNACTFEEGVIKGVMEELTGKRWHVKMLEREGEGKCVIEVKPY